MRGRIRQPRRTCLGAEHGDRHDGRAGFEREPSDAAARADRAGPGGSRVPSGKTTTQSPRSRIARAVSIASPVAGPAVDREGARARSAPTPASASRTARAWPCSRRAGATRRADHERVEEAAVVGGEQQRPACGQVLAADPLHAEVDQEEGHEQRPDHPVEDRVDALLQRALAKPLSSTPACPRGPSRPPPWRSRGATRESFSRTPSACMHPNTPGGGPPLQRADACGHLPGACGHPAGCVRPSTRRPTVRRAGARHSGTRPPRVWRPGTVTHQQLRSERQGEPTRQGGNDAKPRLALQMS